MDKYTFRFEIEISMYKTMRTIGQEQAIKAMNMMADWLQFAGIHMTAKQID